MNKHTSSKHQKYIDVFDYSKNRNADYEDGYVKHKDEDEDSREYWGLGIENESYLMLSKYDIKNRNILCNRKRERYSVDYYKNYNMELFSETLNPFIEKKIVDKSIDMCSNSNNNRGSSKCRNIKKKTISLPSYINGYMFQHVDIYGEHKTEYSKSRDPNKKYCGMSIDEYMNYVSPEYKKLFKKNVTFDGDTIEFITSRFFKTTVKKVLDELSLIKRKFIGELDSHLSGKLLFKDSTIIYPSYNYGFVSFLTNSENLGICNNGTYHLNITLPTKLSNDNKILDMNLFKEKHSNAIRMIQLMEPFLIALYGSPDILHTITAINNTNTDTNTDTNTNTKKDNLYCGGSLRIMMSRYIGLGTYDSDTMESGKKLDDCNPPDYFQRLHNGNCYLPPCKIGFDINYNKFKNHGIELRIFDYFPEEYLCDVLNFILLLCEHSLYKKIDKPQNNTLWNDMAVQCIQSGSEATISHEFYTILADIFDIDMGGCCSCLFDLTTSPQSKVYPILKTVHKISRRLYKRYVENLDHYNNNPLSIIKKMSPNMNPICLVDYNKIIKNKFEGFISDLYK